MTLSLCDLSRPSLHRERACIPGTHPAVGQKVLVVINKIDIIEQRMRSTKSLTSSKTTAGSCWVSSRKFSRSLPVGATGKDTTDEPAAADLWQRSRFEPLERYILETLDQNSRVRLKLLSPLGIAEQILKHCQQMVNDRLTVLG